MKARRITALWMWIAAGWLWAQQGKDIPLHWTVQNGVWTSSVIEVQPLAHNPFINLQVAVYGQRTGEQIRVFYLENRRAIPVPPDKHVSERNAWFGYADLSNASHRIRLKIVPRGPARIRRVKVRLYWPMETSFLKAQAVSPSPSVQSSCNCPYPDVVTRDQWCPNNACPPQSNPVYTDVKFLIVHHTATPNGESDWAARVRQIWDFHVHTRGWADIGYNYLIDQNGLMYVGRGEDVKGAHFSGHNSETCGIAYLGTFNTYEPPAVMHSKFVEYAAFKCCQKELDPTGTAYHASSGLTLHTIAGHRDSGSGTECPGDRLYADLPMLRQRTDSTMCQCSNGLDLAITDTDYSRAEIRAGESITYTVQIKNRSNQSFQDLAVDFQVDGQSVASPTVDLAACGGARASATFSSVQSGWHRACATVPVQSGETDTGNNTACFDFRVIGEDELLKDYVLFPNPAGDRLEVKVPSRKGLVKWRILDLAGRELKSFPGGRRQIPVSFLKPGVYLVELFPVKGSVETRKIQIRK